VDLIGEERGRLARVAGWLDASRSETAGLAILLLGTLVATVVVVWAALGRPDVLPVDGDGAAIGATPGAIGEDGEVATDAASEGTSDGGAADEGHAGHLDAHGHAAHATDDHGAHDHGAAHADPAAATAEVVVHVVGAVGEPGVVAVPAGARVADAIEEAGGLEADADPMRLNLARPVVDGERLVVVREGEEPPEELAGPDVPSSAEGTPEGSTDGVPGGTADGPVDLNRADQATLETLPGIGPAIAGRIVAHREQHGPFRQPGDLRDVSGIGEKRFQDLADLVTVG
jgi:competence protein ComEA